MEKKPTNNVYNNNLRFVISFWNLLFGLKLNKLKINLLTKKLNLKKYVDLSPKVNVYFEEKIKTAFMFPIKIISISFANFDFFFKSLFQLHHKMFQFEMVI